MADRRAFIIWTGSEADNWKFPDPVSFIWKELQQGRLRLGWAPPGSNLVESGRVVPQNVWEKRYVDSVLTNWRRDVTDPLLDPPQRVATRYQILSLLLRFRTNDVLLVPRMPSAEQLTVVRVIGDYRFDDHHYQGIYPDLGHVIPIDAATIATYGYRVSDATRKITAMFQFYRTAITPVRKPELSRLIFRLAD